MCLLTWIVLSWMGTLIWICNGAFRLRALSIAKAAARKREALEHPDQVDHTPYQHPHPQYAFQDIPVLDTNYPNYGLRHRTIMVSNVPHSLRNENELKEYFEYWLSRKVEKPSMGLTSSTQPGMLNKSLAFVFNRAKKLPAKVQSVLPLSNKEDGRDSAQGTRTPPEKMDKPLVERVTVARKMTELASLLERREEILRLLETAHIKLASKALLAVNAAMASKRSRHPFSHYRSTPRAVRMQRQSIAPEGEQGGNEEENTSEEERMEKLIEVLGPFVREFGIDTKPQEETIFKRLKFKILKQKLWKANRHSYDSGTRLGSNSSSDSGCETSYPPADRQDRDSHPVHATVWDALLSLPRCMLDPYQPLVNLSHLFRGRTVPAIDYYTAKLNLLTSLIVENRSKAITDFDPVSTAFVTFANPADARRACKYLAVHPNNPLTCLVTMAPEYQDLDWNRVMKSSFRVEVRSFESVILLSNTD